MTIKQYLLWVIGSCVFTFCFISIMKSCNTEPQQQSPTTEARKQDIKKSDSLGVIEKDVIRERWRTKIKYDTIIKEVLMYDSAQTNAAFDSTVKTKNNAVVVFYKWQRDSLQLKLADSVHVLDTIRISLLTLSDQRADTLLAEANKRAKKRFWAGFKIGFGTGYAAGIGTAAAVK